jgi:hypothetical protein
MNLPPNQSPEPSAVAAVVAIHATSRRWLSFLRRQFHVFLLALLLFLSGAMSVGAASRDEQIAAVKSQMNDAIFKVQDIVNQPVKQLKRTSNMVNVGFFSPGWFHQGATKPDFNTADVRARQEFPYEQYQYVTSDLNPGVVFLGNELEFNSRTKYFYTDRSVPKKKLTEAEMLEINQLYRIIGHCEQQLDELQNPEPPLTRIHRLIVTHRPVVEGFFVVLIVTLLFVNRQRRRARESED